MPDEAELIDEALVKLKEENAAMEAEIASLTAKSFPEAATAAATKAPPPASGGIKVLNFGTSEIAQAAGMDFGSHWCPPSVSRRTVLGGFFTS